MTATKAKDPTAAEVAASLRTQLGAVEEESQRADQETERLRKALADARSEGTDSAPVLAEIQSLAAQQQMIAVRRDTLTAALTHAEQTVRDAQRTPVLERLRTTRDTYLSGCETLDGLLTRVVAEIAKLQAARRSMADTAAELGLDSQTVQGLYGPDPRRESGGNLPCAVLTRLSEVFPVDVSHPHLMFLAGLAPKEREWLGRMIP